MFGWNTVINLFYLPGTLFGAFVSDWIGPRYTLALGVTLQAVVGFAMAGAYATLSQPAVVGGFAVVYGRKFFPFSLSLSPLPLFPSPPYRSSTRPTCTTNPEMRVK